MQTVSPFFELQVIVKLEIYPSVPFYYLQTSLLLQLFPFLPLCMYSQMVCTVHKLSKFRPNPNQQIQLNKRLINQIHKPQTAVKTHLVTHSGFQIYQTMTEDLPAACHSIFQGVRVAWCTPKFCTSTEFTYNLSECLQDTPSPSIQAQLQEPLCHSAFALFMMCSMWNSLTSIV